jgi:uncharacterized YccA/Bax inhibitor family protein
VRTTTNPAIRNLLPSGGSRPLDVVADAGSTTSSTTNRPITVDDVVTRSAISLGAIVGSAVLTVVFELHAVALPALLIGLGIGLLLVLRPRPNAALTLLYCGAQGIVLGAGTHALNWVHPGIGTQAVIGTCAVAVAMLVVYKIRLIRIGTKLTRWVVGVGLGLALALLVNLVAAAVFHVDLGLRDGGVVAIIVSVACIAAASLSFLLNFEAADRLIRAGAASRWAWYVAFGLAMTLVWLYLEILWLLSYFR